MEINKTSADVETIKRYCWEHLDGMQVYLGRISDAIFSYAELGLQEHRSAALLSRELERHGYKVERGVCGMASAFCASFGEGSPVLAVHSEYDAIPRLSQRAGLIEPAPIVAGAPGHAEGHNCNAGAFLGTAIALADVMRRFGLPGRILAVGAPGEEQFVSRPFMVRDGLFRGVDAALHGHIGSSFETSYGLTQSSLISAMFHFSGKSTQGGRAWLGISALDAMQLMNVGWEMLREHLSPEQRSHHVTVSGGDQPSEVPAEATTWYYFRHPNPEGAQALLDRARNVAQGACLMTGASVQEEIVTACWPSRGNRRLAELAHANMLQVGVPSWTEDEEELARQVQGQAGVPVLGLPRAVSALRESQQEVSVSDMGDVTWVVPHVRIVFPGQPVGLIFHHWTAGILPATPLAHRGLVAGAKAMAGTLIDLLASPKLLDEVKESFQKEIGGIVYNSAIPAGSPPPIHLNLETMERCRPLMEPFYYDPEQPEDYLTSMDKEAGG